ncbi:MAG: phosphatidate cytidylyltransferase [Eubacteriales bacterium]|nr:phosphatidate cytidylyltransferase [Eubacteriales bacterium]
MFFKRLISGIILLAAAIALFYIGGIPLLIVVCLIALTGQKELYKAIGIDHKALSLIGYVMTVVYYGLLLVEGKDYMTAIMVGSLLSMMTAYVATFPEYKTEQVSGAYFGFIYVSVLMSFIYLTRAHSDGIYFVWLILLSAWGCDTCAYCVGRLIGKHKMAVKLSPKKTIEGAIGGFVGSAALGALYGFIFAGKMDTPFPVLICAIACGAGAVISMIGDLAASAIKRNHDIKDFGNLIPGHGGILDRFDSMLFAAPAIYYAILFMERFF